MYQGLSLEQAPPLEIPFRFFLTAPLFLAGAGLLLAWLGADLVLFPGAPSTIALTHSVTLGWLAMIMLGAFYQMIPVMIGGSVPWLAASRWVHGMLVLGILGFVLFFFLLQPALLLVPVLLLGLALGIFLLQCGIALLRITEDRPTSQAMRLSLASLAGVLLLGVAGLGAWGQWWNLPWPSESLRGIHLLWGVFGWVGLLILGVSLHLIPMFYVTPGFAAEDSQRMLRLISISLVLVPLGLLMNWPLGLQLLGAAFGLAGWVLYLVRIRQQFQARRRKRPDPTVTLWQTGLTWLALGLAAGLGGWVADLDQLWFFFALCLLLGFAGNITLGMLFKISSFLVWFHRFSSRIGEAGVPMLADLLPEEPQTQLVWGFNLCLAALGLGVLFTLDLAVRLGGLGLTAVGLRLFWLLWGLARAR